MQPNNPQPNNPYYPPNNAMPPVAGGPSPIVPQPVSQSTFKSQRPLGLIIAVIILSALLVATIGVGYWIFTERQDYKNNVDKHVSVAVAKAEKSTTDKNNKKFAEELKNPLKKYTGPSSYGSISLDYPKTWSGYVGATSTGNSVFNAYFHPDVVPNVAAGSQEKTAVALQVQVISQTYDTYVATKSSYVTGGKLVAEPFALEKNPGVVGVMFTGEMQPSRLQGRQIVLPLRDKTIVITMETDQFMNDIRTYILPSLTFVP